MLQFEPTVALSLLELDSAARRLPLGDKTPLESKDKVEEYTSNTNQYTVNIEWHPQLQLEF